MIRQIVARRIVLPVALSLASLALAGSPPCGVLLGPYLEEHGGRVLPCLVDLQEAGMCFRLPGMTLETATRTVDGHLQSRGVARPDWTTTSGADGTFVPGPGGERVEIVLAAEGPFSTTGTCRVMPSR